MNVENSLTVKYFANADYQSIHQQMLEKTLERIALHKQGTDVADELWVVEHRDVYTLGQAGKEHHILSRNNTPIIKTDRGGQVTWHGTGQLVMYWLFDLNRLGWKVRDLVSHAEQSIEDVLNKDLKLSAVAKARQDAPGVYLYQQLNELTKSKADASHTRVSNACNEDNMIGKVASLGFKIKQGFSYHGIAVNVNCDLTPFSLINPCGYAGMQMVRVVDFLDNNVDSDTDKSAVQSDFPVLESSITDMLIRNISLRHGNKLQLRCC